MPKQLASHTTGGAAIAAGLSVQWLLHAVSATVPFPLFGAGAWVIRHSPGSLATFAIESAGKDAKPGLALGLAVLLVAAGAAIGAGVVRTPALLVVASLVAGVIDPVGASARGLVLAVAGGGLAALVVVVGTEVAFETATPAERRREFIGLAGSMAACALIFGITARRSTPRAEAELVLPAKRFNAEPDPAFPEVPGLSSQITSPEDHYVVDINFEAPVVSAKDWRLEVEAKGKKTALGLEKILALPSEELPVFLECVSNTIGGALASNGLWACVALGDVVSASGLAENYATVLAHAVDGYSAAIPAEHLGEVRLAYAMSGEAIPRRHGFPVRLLWPGRYGMLSVKWLTRLELLDKRAEGYWAERGWDREGLLETGSRIDVPARSADVKSMLTVAGVAWARGGISSVEVSVDEEETWMQATLEEPLNDLSWRRWQTEVELPAGRSTISARATDGSGRPQEAESNAPHPGGATGIHRVIVEAKYS
ncbi:MAG: molybdopterin-dependent oxidoreductase [Dehalococcoidia bacterium]